MNKSFKYVSNIQKKKQFAEMLIYSEIGNKAGQVNGLNFANELRYLTNLDYINEVKVRINSVGGGVMHAFSIFSSIMNANSTDNGTDVNTYLDGVAASSAGWILLAGKNVYTKDYGRLMVHGVAPIDENGEIQTIGLTKNDLSALANFKEMIVEVIVGRSKLKKSIVSNLLTNGRDNWFNVTQAVEMGLLNSKNIQKTGLDIELPENLSRNALAVANKAQKFINNINSTKNILKMEKVINALKLQEGANEATVLKAVNKALETAKVAKENLVLAENKAVEDGKTIAKLTAQVSAGNKAAALEVVENAIKEGKFAPADEAAKEALVSQAEAGLENFKNLISQMPTRSKNILDGGDAGKGGNKSIIEKIANRGFRQLEKEDSALLKQVKDSDLPTYVNLYNKEYGTEKVANDFA